MNVNENSKNIELSNINKILDESLKTENIEIVITDKKPNENKKEKKKEFIEEDLFNDEDEYNTETKLKKCIEKICSFMNSDPKIKKYLKKIFTTLFIVLFGSSILLLIVVLFSDLNPSIIPFEIARIEFNSTVNLTQEMSIFFTFLSFVTSNILFMRIVLIFSFGIGICSMILAPPPPNLAFIMWYILVLLINIKHSLQIIYNKRNIKFDENNEQIYNKIFRKLMSKNDFQILMTNSLIRIVKKNTYYINLGDSCSNLSILLFGEMIKTDQNGKQTLVKVNSFIDSPEFIMRKYKVGQVFTISFYAKTECKIVIWPREMLEITLKKNKDLYNKLLAALGIDVSNKFIAYSL